MVWSQFAPCQLASHVHTPVVSCNPFNLVFQAVTCTKDCGACSVDASHSSAWIDHCCNHRILVWKWVIQVHFTCHRERSRRSRFRWSRDLLWSCCGTPFKKENGLEEHPFLHQTFEHIFRTHNRLSAYIVHCISKKGAFESGRVEWIGKTATSREFGSEWRAEWITEKHYEGRIVHVSDT